MTTATLASAPARGRVWTGRILGAVLLTGYLGGAVAIHVRAGTGAFPVAFTLVTGALVWIAVALREPGLGRWLGARP